MQEIYGNAEEVKKFKRKQLVKDIFTYVFLTIFALFTLLPFYWMLATSFKSTNELNTAIHATFFPQEFTFDVYKDFFTNPTYSILFRYMGNTIIVGVCTTALSVCTTVLAAFAFSRLSFRGKELIFSLLLATMMIPGEMMIITNFTTIASWGWLNTYQALIIPFVASVFYTFFLRQNFRQIPDELYYAAKVDGNSDFAYLFKVMIPIAKPSIITITILQMISSWNAYIWPRTVSSGKEMKLVTDGIMSISSAVGAEGAVVDNYIMAGATLVSLPLLIAFIVFKKYIMRGVARSGIKG